MSATEARGLVISALHQLIDMLTQISDSSSLTQASKSNDLPLLLDATQAAKLLSLSRQKVCDMANCGEIPAIRVGRVVRIPRDPLVEWIERGASATSSRAAVRVPAWAHVDRSQEL